MGTNSSSECLVIPELFVETGDGPWQSELTSHAGDSKPCRFCEVGGTTEERSSDIGFLAIMKVSHFFAQASLHLFKTEIAARRGANTSADC